MVDLSEYERRGDLDAPFELTKKHERAQQQSERMRDAVTCRTAPLGWEQYAAGEPCPGCGLPYQSEEPWTSKGTMYYTDDEHARSDAEETRFREAHAGCHALRHSVSGSITLHCGKCCPWPPLSPGKALELARMLGSMASKQPHELMRWRLRLYCGHVVERTAHYTHKNMHSAFTGTTSCRECGLDPATIVDGQAMGLAGEVPGVPKARTPTDRRQPAKRTRVELEARVLELEAELEKLRGS